MTFRLQPGDYIRISAVPKDKRRDVVRAFAKAGAKNINKAKGKS